MVLIFDRFLDFKFLTFWCPGGPRGTPKFLVQIIFKSNLSLVEPLLGSDADSEAVLRDAL